MVDELSGSVPATSVGSTAPNPTSQIPQEPTAKAPKTAEIIEEARSAVRRRVTYGAGIVGAFIVVYAALTKNGELTGWGTGLISGVIGFWFGQRNNVPPPTK